MPLLYPAERDLIQTRKVEVSSFRRRDGLWDVEGRLTDVAALPIKNYTGGMIEAGTPPATKSREAPRSVRIRIISREKAMAKPCSFQPDPRPKADADVAQVGTRWIPTDVFPRNSSSHAGSTRVRTGHGLRGTNCGHVLPQFFARK